MKFDSAVIEPNQLSGAANVNCIIILYVILFIIVVLLISIISDLLFCIRFIYWIFFIAKSIL